MTLPTVGTTAGAQAANSSVAATATAAGTITFVGPSGIQGSTITCVVTVPGAPGGALFNGILGTASGQGVIVDTWGGSATAGQFQILVGQTLVVNGTGLAPGAAYTCTFATVTDTGAVQVVIPDPNSSAELASLANAGIAGVNILSIDENLILSGANVTAVLIPQAFQLWNWGWYSTAAGVGPTMGTGLLNLFSGPGAASDAVTVQNGASNRLAGLQCAAGTTIQIVNNFDATTSFFIVYSLS